MKKKLIIISGPSGAGEDSVIEGLKKRLNVEKIVTTTTREIRPGEVDGETYYFISKDEFKKGIESGRFFEYAKQDRGNYYGVTHEEIERVKESDAVGIWKIDYKGVINAKQLLDTSDTVAILLVVPLEVLEQRLRGRAGSDEDFIAKRLEYAKGWYAHRDVFDYEVENKQGYLTATIDAVESIIRRELALDKNSEL